MREFNQENIALSLMHHKKHYMTIGKVYGDYSDLYDLAEKIIENPKHKFREMAEELVPLLPEGYTKDYANKHKNE